ncbi:MAG: hypothetical protein ABIQ59_10350 [Nocardioidaceae bacterium]
MDSGYLLSGEAGVCGYGEIEWRYINGAWRGVCTLTAPNYGPPALTLEIQVRPQRPSEITVVYLVNGDLLRRIDVNGAHKGRRYSHVQGKRSSEDAETTEPVPEWFVTVPFARTVSEAAYRQVFFDAAKLFKVDAAAIAWSDPPEGSA